ncbi:MAG: MOSC domain-containing protein [Nocardioides sp.]
MTVTQLHLYPLKSAGGHRVEEAAVQPWGLVGDRRWALVDAAGRHPWLGEHPGSLAISAQALPGGRIRLRNAADWIDLAPEECGPAIAVDFPGLDEALPAAPAADRWISEALGEDLHLIHLPAGATRVVSAEHGGLAGEVTSLAWDAPLHLVTQESLDQLADWIEERAAEDGTDPAGVLPLDPARFRPNLVVSGFEPFAEDRWTHVRIGEVDYRVSEICDRCAVTLYDPTTAAKAKEPIRTLARKRSWGGKTWFGIRLVPLQAGSLAVGDPVLPRVDA